MNIRFTLVAEGSTDAALLPILKWAVQSDQRVGRVEPSFAEPGMLPPARLGVAERIRRALELFPADLLFVHRDADRVPTATRRDEICRAAEATMANQLTVPVVPVRMTEAWLLIDEAASTARLQPCSTAGCAYQRWSERDLSLWRSRMLCPHGSDASGSGGPASNCLTGCWTIEIPAGRNEMPNGAAGCCTTTRADSVTGCDSF